MKKKNILFLFDAMISVGKINTGITVSHYNAFNYKIMSYFGDLEEFKNKAVKFKNNAEIYNKHKISIDLFLTNYERRNSDQLPI